MMSVRLLETLTWRLIFGGMIVFGLGIAVQETDGTLGLLLLAGGVVLFVAGCVMVWMRSRMPPADE